MRRQIFMWMGLGVLFVLLGFTGEVSAANQYKVKSGDNLAKISKKTGISIKELRETNKLQSDSLKPGQILALPAPANKKVANSKKIIPAATKAHVVKKGDTIAAIARENGISAGDISSTNNLRNDRLSIGQRLVLPMAATAATAQGRANQAVRAQQSALRNDEELEEDESLLPGAEDLTQTDDVEENPYYLGKWESPSEPQLLAKVAMGFLGAPYRLGGSSVRGIDCSAFVKMIYAFFDINLPRTAREQARIGKPVNRSELEIGDLVFFNTRRVFGHVGVYIGNNEFVHASSGRARSVKVDTLDKPYYDKRFVKAVRLKTADDDN